MKKNRGETILTILKLIIYGLWKLKLDYIISTFLGIVIILYNKNEIVRKKQKTVILAMQRGAFSDDVKALRGFPSKYKILFYPFILRAITCDDPDKIFPTKLQEQNFFYAKKDEYKDLFERLSEIFYITLIFVEAVLQNRIDIVLTANTDYYQDYSWIKAIHKKKGKFVTLFKESIFYMPERIEKRLISRHKETGFKFEGDAVLFYNELAKKLYVKAGEVRPDQAFVTGCPRVDRLVSLSKNKGKKTDVAILTSFVKPHYRAINLWNEILEAVYQDELLRSKTIVKCKSVEEEKNIKNQYPDISVASDSIENYFKTNPAIFIGFNSTVCIDALITEIPLLIPWWGDAKATGTDTFLGKHTSDFHLIAYDKKSLTEIMKDYVTNTNVRKTTPTITNNQKMKKFVEEKYSLADGENCRRFFNIIDQLLRQ